LYTFSTVIVAWAWRIFNYADRKNRMINKKLRNISGE
jgi:hypothetical protein